MDARQDGVRRTWGAEPSENDSSDCIEDGGSVETGCKDDELMAEMRLQEGSTTRRTGWPPRISSKRCARVSAGVVDEIRRLRHRIMTEIDLEGSSVDGPRQFGQGRWSSVSMPAQNGM